MMQTEYLISPLFKQKETAEEVDIKQTPQTNYREKWVAGGRMTGRSKCSFGHLKDLASLLSFNDRINNACCVASMIQTFSTTLKYLV